MKQSMSVVVAIFVNWGILIAFAVLYMILPVGSALSPEVFLLISAVIMETASAALLEGAHNLGSRAGYLPVMSASERRRVVL